MYQKLGRSRKQAYGINTTTLQDMLKSTNQNSLRGFRDQALLLVAYDSLCRRSELVSLQVSDLIIKDNGESQTLRLRLRRSKTDPEATERWLYLSDQAQAALLTWLKQSGIHEGMFFRGITKGGKITSSLTSSQINRIYKKLARATKLSPETINHISGTQCA